jgi:hypothetical protein
MMSLQDRQSVFQDVSARASMGTDAESIRFDLQKRIRFMKLQLEESQELISELEGEKVDAEFALKFQKDLVFQEKAKCQQLEADLTRIRDALEPAQAMLAEERSSKKLIQEDLQKSDTQVRSLLLKEIDYRRMMQETEESCLKRINAASSDCEMRWKLKTGEQETALRRQFEEEHKRSQTKFEEEQRRLQQKFEGEQSQLQHKNEILSSQVELLAGEKKSLMDFWDRERDVLLKEHLLESEKMQDKIRSKDLSIENLNESLRSKDEALEGFVIASKSQTSAFKLKSDEHKSILQQTNAVARTSIPEIRILRKELLVQRQLCLQMFKSSQHDLLMLQTCMIELSEKSLQQSALHFKLERMFEAAAEVACDASGLFAKAVFAQKE